MPKDGKSLAESTAEEIFNMIVVDKKYLPGEKIPNENELSTKMRVSRSTLREAIKILETGNVLEIRRGRGTFVTSLNGVDTIGGIEKLASVKVNLKDLYEMRMLFEPQIAYYAAIRGTDKEIERIIYYGEKEEKSIKKNLDSTEIEQAFHRSIVKAAHNEFMEKLMPILYKAINSSTHINSAYINVIDDHRMIMDFLQKRDAEAAKAAMHLHIIHNMRNLGIKI